MNERKIVELALGTADVQAITPKVIAKTIDETAKHLVVFSQLFREQHDLEKTKGRRLIVPKMLGGIHVTSGLAPGQTVPLSTFSYDATTIDVTKFGIKLKIPREALEVPVRDLLKDILYESGREWAKELDLRAMTIALDLRTGSITTWSGGTLGTTTLTPIIGITSVPPSATIDSVDYYDGKVKLTSSISTGTLVFLYSNRCKSTGLYAEVNSPETLRIWDVLKLRATLIDKTISPDILLVHPRELETLLYDPNTQAMFVSCVEYAPGVDKLNGEIGRIVDFRVLSSAHVPEGIGIMVDSSKLGWDVHKRPLEGTAEDKPEEDSVIYHMYAEREFGVNNNNAVGVLVNAKTGQYKAGDL